MSSSFDAHLAGLIQTGDPPVDALREEDLPEKMKAARDYLYKNRIPQLFQHLLMRTILEKPRDLKNFLVKELAAVHSAMDERREFLGNFTTDDISVMYDMLDLHNVGYITKSQLELALRQLRGGHPSAAAVSVDVPEDAKIEKVAFVKIIKQELAKAYSYTEDTVE
uniref:EF-hand domain-containing protein n=1 Tax=Chromera velia CCMP2878 TaxID=1169474 RepID=A0A0G4G786_9ALVE|mmetsp:Transcript_12141/g.23474  ORF Transcript_12141/g.23474 Transcript_12141/m.23474 type:complete len:166 (-) Transcript_12141:348-845(-)|eukprot:Cvel_20551.t1-p1 / transcript=Cvel_20551.t1 / gene=Cvel_20551 / organism=Chromera_velia_CCMP2878 / gene_product=hypothetical protein / transcript_product=hypothetical protein / location=Cvel_scaffold1854:35929-36423(+) / protein_length=165 / sequence_SO=supercontig / SO=protein_coding / is_pseudo=false